MSFARISSTSKRLNETKTKQKTNLRHFITIKKKREKIKINKWDNKDELKHIFHKCILVALYELKKKRLFFPSASFFSFLFKCIFRTSLFLFLHAKYNKKKKSKIKQTSLFTHHKQKIIAIFLRCIRKVCFVILFVLFFCIFSCKSDNNGKVYAISISVFNISIVNIKKKAEMKCTVLSHSCAKFKMIVIGVAVFNHWIYTLLRAMSVVKKKHGFPELNMHRKHNNIKCTCNKKKKKYLRRDKRKHNKLG